MKPETKTTQVEIWVLVNECGDAVANTDKEAAADQFEESIGDIKAQEATRWIKVTLTVPLPKVAEMTGVVPVEEEAGELVAA